MMLMDGDYSPSTSDFPSGGLNPAEIIKKGSGLLQSFNKPSIFSTTTDEILLDVSSSISHNTTIFFWVQDERGENFALDIERIEVVASHDTTPNNVANMVNAAIIYGGAGSYFDFAPSDVIASDRGIIIPGDPGGALAVQPTYLAAPIGTNENSDSVTDSDEFTSGSSNPTYVFGSSDLSDVRPWVGSSAGLNNKQTFEMNDLVIGYKYVLTIDPSYVSSRKNYLATATGAYIDNANEHFWAVPGISINKNWGITFHAQQTSVTIEIAGEETSGSHYMYFDSTKLQLASNVPPYYEVFYFVTDEPVTSIYGFTFTDCHLRIGARNNGGPGSATLQYAYGAHDRVSTGGRSTFITRPIVQVRDINVIDEFRYVNLIPLGRGFLANSDTLSNATAWDLSATIITAIDTNISDNTISKRVVQGCN